MAKRSRQRDASTEVATDPKARAKARRKMTRLERELAKLRATEAKRLEQLKDVRARAVDVRTRLAALRAVVAATAEGSASEAGGVGPVGYCMREKRPVEISDPRPVTLSNGRAAIAGTCSICGARVMVLSARPAS